MATPILPGLPFGLTWSELGTLQPEPMAWTSRDPAGMHKGQSCILTFADGTAIFVKRTHGEAAKYRYLAACSVPTPRLLHTVERDDHEIILLECLPHIGIEPSQADDLLRLIARLNAILDVPRELFAPGPGRTDFDDLMRAALTQVTTDAPRWLDLYHAAANTVATFPLALNHDEMGLQQVGRSAAGELVVFDLETLSLRPRFTDLAGVLEPLAKKSGTPEGELFQSYHNATDWPELLWTRLVVSFESLPGLVNDRPDEADPPLRVVRRISRDATQLGWTLPPTCRDRS